ncbi:MAG TPA: hypothetical protein VFS33_02490 [Gemmatimonadales bacterium]|nr:hypothetical protein [Gemmatimonadales bacterium]
MNRRGIALLTVLWLLVVLGVLIGTALMLAHEGAGITRNRVVLARAGWAREACADILLARYADSGTVRPIDTTALGGGTWCIAMVEDPSAKLNLNLADEDALRALLGRDSLVAALLDWRDPDDITRDGGAESDWYRGVGRRLPRNGPLADVAELLAIRGFDAALVHRLDSLVTTRSDGRLNLNAAPEAVLATLPALGSSGVAAIMRQRSIGAEVHGLDDLMGWLAPDARIAVMRQYQALALRVSGAPSRYVVTVRGGVAGADPVATAVLTVVPVGRRLAAVRRETE